MYPYAVSFLILTQVKLYVSALFKLIWVSMSAFLCLVDSDIVSF